VIEEGFPIEIDVKDFYFETSDEETISEYDRELERRMLQREIELTEYGLNCPEWFKLETFKPAEKIPEIIPEKNYLITGQPNEGKTHLACGIARKLTADGHGVAERIFEPEFAEFYKMHIGRYTNDLKNYIQKITRADILLWDDMCRTFSMYPDVKNSLLNIFNKRAEKRLQTIVTCQFGYDEIVRQFGQDFLRRVIRKEGKKENHIEVCL